MTDPNWIASTISAARPQAMGALLRYFRDLDTAEEAFQDACLRAIKNWPQNGPPRDPAAWLIFVGRNSGIDAVRKRSKQAPMPEEDQVSDLEDAESDMAERLDGAHYRDDILRLLFICCHPDLPQTQQIAPALRIVSGLSVKQIARAFLVGESAMEQRITRAKARVADGSVPFETPGPVERSERLAAVAAMIYLVFNEGYLASAGASALRTDLCAEAIRLARLLDTLIDEPEVRGLLALMLLQDARRAARVRNGEIVPLEEQDRTLWNTAQIAEGQALVRQALAGRFSLYSVQAAIAAAHRPEGSDWPRIVGFYDMLMRIDPAPIVALNRAVAVAMRDGPAAGLALVDGLAMHGYRLWHAARADLLRRMERNDEARRAYQAALDLTVQEAERRFIERRLRAL